MQLFLMVYITNRSRWTMEQALLSGSSERELQELIQGRLLPYRRKYIVFGPHSFDQQKLQQEKLVRIRRTHAEMLKNLRMQLNLIPPDVAHAFQILGLPYDASFGDIRQSYRALAKRTHPDTGGDQEQFQQINAGYNCLIKWIEAQA